MGLHGGAPLIPQHRLQAAGLFHLGGKGLVQLRPGALGAVHIPGKPHHQLVHLVFLHQPGQLLRHHIRLTAVDDGGISGQQAGGIGDGNARPGVAVINGHDTQDHHSFFCFLHYTKGMKKKQVETA